MSIKPRDVSQMYVLTNVRMYVYVCVCARCIYTYTDVYGYTSANSEITETAHLPFNSFSFCVSLIAMDTIMSMFQRL